MDHSPLYFTPTCDCSIVLRRTGVTYSLYYSFVTMAYSTQPPRTGLHNTRFAPVFVTFDSVCDIYIPKNRISRESREFAFLKLVIVECFRLIFDVDGCYKKPPTSLHKHSQMSIHIYF